MINLSKQNLIRYRLRGTDITTHRLSPESDASKAPIPGLKGLVGMYGAYGLTNEEMKANPVWRDKSGNGNHIQLKNFAWELRSGVGMYEYNFNKAVFVADSKYVNKYDNKAAFFKVVNSVTFRKNIHDGNNTFKCKIKVSGLDNAILNGEVKLLRIYDNINSDRRQDVLNDGIYDINYTANEGATVIYIYLLPVISSDVTLQEPVIIEQIPTYENALCFDGVDDYGICEAFPIFTKEKGYTVMALRKWINPFTSINNASVSNIREWAEGGSFALDRIVADLENKTYKSTAYNFGQTQSTAIIPNMVSWQTSTLNNGLPINSGDALGTPTLRVGMLNNYKNHANFALYALAIIDHDTTAEERQLVIDYWKREYPELFPDQAWTVTGKTNSDADRATIKNITGNGNNLVLTNFAFEGNSGYSESSDYEGYLLTDGVDDQIVSSQNVPLSKDYTIVGDWKLLVNETKSCGIVRSGQFYLYNNARGLRLYLNAWSINTVLENIKSLKAICSNGKVYDENWNEIVIKTGDTVATPDKLYLGYLDLNYTRIAFKNLSIYNDTILTKEQCIRAYNYLQTIKNN